MIVQSFKDLQVWKIGMMLAEEVYRLTETFPKRETYALISQMQRAAVSVPSNIAEGHARDSTKEFLHYISIAMGSLDELETQLLLAGRLDYIDNTRTRSILSRTSELGRMLRGLQKTLKAKLQPPVPSP